MCARERDRAREREREIAMTKKAVAALDTFLGRVGSISVDCGVEERAFREICSDLLSFARICSDLLRFAQNCSNLLRFAQIC